MRLRGSTHLNVKFFSPGGGGGGMWYFMVIQLWPLTLCGSYAISTGLITYCITKVTNID